MSLFRVATLLVMCGIALSAVGKSATPQDSATKKARLYDSRQEGHRGQEQPRSDAPGEFQASCGARFEDWIWDGCRALPTRVAGKRI
jgi:hypothetical protein